MALYHMAMPPHYGGSHPPSMHSPMFPGPLLPPVDHFNPPSHNITSGVSIGHTQPSIYHPHQGMIYANPYLGMPNSASSPLNISSIPHLAHPASQTLHPPNIGYGPSNVTLLNIQPTQSPLLSHPQHLDSFAANHRQHLSVDEELLEEMNALHLGYIETEDSPQKMQQREKLEDVILEYLAITPHSHKFMHHEVLEVLENSVRNYEDFNAHQAACAFDALAQYAVNLISQPWRKEFREIKLYNGFWVHQVANHLSGAESIMELMGYVCMKVKGSLSSPTASSSFPSRRISSAYYVLEGVIDPDLISRLALDCMIAYCECQCLKKIYEGVSEYGLSMSQILHFRQLYIGGVDVTLRHLLFTVRQQMHATRPDLPLDSPDRGHHPTSPPPVPSRHSSNYAVGTSMTKLPTPTSVCTEKGNGSTSNSSSSVLTKVRNHGIPPDTVDSVPKTNRSQSLGNPNHHPHFAVSCKEQGLHPKGNPGQVPTAQLIDLDSSQESMHSLIGKHSNHHLLPKVVPHKSSKALHGATRNNITKESPESVHFPEEVFQAGTLDEHLEATLSLVKNPNRNSATANDNNPEKDGASWDSWEFVYKGLEKKGYYKAVGDRGNILQEIAKQTPSEENSQARNLNLNNQRESLKNRPLPLNQALKQLSIAESREETDKPTNRSSNSQPDQHFRHHRNSLYDNVSGGFETAHQYSDELEDHKPLKKINNALRNENKGENNRNPTSNIVSSKNSSMSSSRELLSALSPQLDHLSSKSLKSINTITNKEEKTWACDPCTFINSSRRKSCEMCGKSKHPGPEVQPLVSGGKQCPFLYPN